MNTKTILSTKTDKNLKKEAQKVAGEIGVPLSTVINAFLKQFIREKEVVLSANKEVPSKYLLEVMEQTELNLAEGNLQKIGKEDLLKKLRTL